MSLFAVLRKSRGLGTLTGIYVGVCIALRSFQRLLSLCRLSSLRKWCGIIWERPAASLNLQAYSFVLNSENECRGKWTLKHSLWGSLWMCDMDPKLSVLLEGEALHYLFDFSAKGKPFSWGLWIRYLASWSCTFWALDLGSEKKEKHEWIRVCMCESDGCLLVHPAMSAAEFTRRGGGWEMLQLLSSTIHFFLAHSVDKFLPYAKEPIQYYWGWMQLELYNPGFLFWRAGAYRLAPIAVVHVIYKISSSR